MEIFANNHGIINSYQLSAQGDNVAFHHQYRLLAALQRKAKRVQQVDDSDGRNILIN